MEKRIQSLGWAIQGIKTVWREEISFRIECFFSVCALGLGVYVHLSYIDWVIIILSISGLLAAEIINTAIEDVCNKIEPNYDPIIGKIKDIMAGFVLIVFASGIIISMVIFWQYF